MRDPSTSGINGFRVRKGPGASTDSYGNYGQFSIPLRDKVRAAVICSGGEEPNEGGWEHVSVHIYYLNRKMKFKKRTPSWEEMCKIKKLFWEDHETVVQFHPAQSDYVNLHDHCLHLWRNKNWDLQLPPTEFV